MKAVVSMLIVLVFGSALAQPVPPQLPKRFPWDHRPNKCFLPTGDGLPHGPMCAEPARWPNYAETKHHLDMLLAEQDYDLIEQGEREVGFSRERFDSGEYLFDAWFASLDTFSDAWGERAKAVAEGWAKAKGREGYAPLAQGLVLYHEAWKARGRGYASTVTPEAWAIFYRKLDEADAMLDTASPKVKGMGPWYLAKLRIAFVRQDKRPTVPGLLERATAAWPEYLPLYSVAMTFASPRWGGSFEEMDGVARYALERTKGTRGAAMYAMTYERYFRGAGDGQATLKDSAVDWALMKQGFRDLEKDGKAPEWIPRNFAALACQMRDRDEARRLYELYERRKTAGPAEPDNPCRAFAMSL
ncbi:MAG TPA: hypothetical protein VIV54_01405 [Burkholderiales bacterium]